MTRQQGWFGLPVRASTCIGLLVLLGLAIVTMFLFSLGPFFSWRDGTLLITSECTPTVRNMLGVVSIVPKRIPGHGLQSISLPPGTYTVSTLFCPVTIYDGVWTVVVHSGKTVMVPRVANSGGP